MERESYGGNSMKFKKKPTIVEAVQWTGKNEVEITEFSSDARGIIWKHSKELLGVDTIEGLTKISIGGWIIKDINGNLSTCVENLFNEYYEPIME